MSWAGVSNSFQLQGEQSWDLFTKFNLKNILKKYKNTSADLKKKTKKENPNQPTNQTKNNHKTTTFLWMIQILQRFYILIDKEGVLDNKVELNLLRIWSLSYQFRR